MVWEIRNKREWSPADLRKCFRIEGALAVETVAFDECEPRMCREVFAEMCREIAIKFNGKKFGAARENLLAHGSGARTDLNDHRTLSDCTRVHKLFQ